MTVHYLDGQVSTASDAAAFNEYAHNDLVRKLELAKAELLRKLADYLEEPDSPFHESEVLSAMRGCRWAAHALRGRK